MALQNPFEWLPSAARTRVFVILTVLALVVMAGLQVLGGPLKTEASPLGIVSFEFAGDLTTAQRMLDAWGPRGQVYAGLNLGLDYLFIVAYTGAIGLGCVLVAHSFSRGAASLSAAGVVLAWAQLAAGALDCVENYALIQVLLGSQRTLWPALARSCALPKFVIVALGLGYVVLGAIGIRVVKGRRLRGPAA